MRLHLKRSHARTVVSYYCCKICRKLMISCDPKVLWLNSPSSVARHICFARRIKSFIFGGMKAGASYTYINTPGDEIPVRPSDGYRRRRLKPHSLCRRGGEGLVIKILYMQIIRRVIKTTRFCRRRRRRRRRGKIGNPLQTFKANKLGQL